MPTILPAPTLPAHAVDVEFIAPGELLRYRGGSTSSVEPPGGYWMYRVSMGKMKLAEARPWKSLILQMCKASNWTQFTPPGYPGPGTGYSGSTPQVDGAGQLGLTLDLKNMTAITNVALEGDLFQVGNFLHMLTADLTAGGLGKATANIFPALRESPSDSANVDIQTPKVTVALKNRKAAWRYARSSLFHDFVAEFVEVW